MLAEVTSDMRAKVGRRLLITEVDNTTCYLGALPVFLFSSFLSLELLQDHGRKVAFDSTGGWPPPFLHLSTKHVVLRSTP